MTKGDYLHHFQVYLLAVLFLTLLGVITLYESSLFVWMPAIEHCHMFFGNVVRLSPH